MRNLENYPSSKTTLLGHDTCEGIRKVPDEVVPLHPENEVTGFYPQPADLGESKM